MTYQILFRPLAHDCLPKCADPSSHYWHVEAYDDECPWPLGVAYVRDSTEVEDVSPPLAVEIQYLCVLDGWRRKGVGAALYRAVKERWPSAYNSPSTEDGEAFLEACRSESE